MSGEIIQGPLKRGERVRHKRTGGHYCIVEGDAQVKIDNLCEWSPCVVYQQDGTQAIFARNTAAFRHNFERIPGSGPR